MKMRLEKRYGIKIVDDTFWNPRTQRFVKGYKFYSADGCQWENGLPTLKRVEEECKQWAEALLDIKKAVKRG